MAVLKDLIVHGNSNFLNTSYFNALEADTGKFRKLATKILGSDGETITVYGLMDVQGELHTKSWTNSNIATIDGSFFICPTLKVTETGSTSNGLTISQSGSTWTIQVTSSSAVVTNTVYTMNSSGTVSSSGAWTLGSKVTITGEILVGNEWIPLGTLRGRITQRASDLKSVTISYITDGYSSSNNILTTIGTQNNVKHRNVKIALYEWSLSDSSTPASATTNPIGIYMTALGDGTGQTIIDIYGGQEAASATYKGLAKPYVRIGNLNGLSSLTIGGQNPSGWGLYTSNGYFEGTVAARRGYIGNNTKYWTIGTSGNNSTIFSGPTTVSATSTAGTYLGTDGFLNTASSTTYAQITNGVLTAYGAVIRGALTATSLATGNPARTGTGTGTAGTYIASDGAIYVGSNNDFTVTAAGAVTAKSGTIGGWSINSSYGIYTNSKTSATSTNSGILIQKDGNIYAGAYNSTAASCPFQVTNAGVLTAVNANLKGLTIYDTSGKKRAGVESTGFIIYDGASATTTTQLASFGSTVQIGNKNSLHFQMATDNLGYYVDTTPVLSLNCSYEPDPEDEEEVGSKFAEFKLLQSWNPTDESKASLIMNYAHASGQPTYCRLAAREYIYASQTNEAYIDTRVTGGTAKLTLRTYNNSSKNVSLVLGGESDSGYCVTITGSLIVTGCAGMILMYGGSTAPRGWLLCNGQAVGRTAYAALFAAIGTTFGAGDGSTTFNVPDLQGRVAIGVSSSHALASTGGAETVTLTAAQSGVPAHKHSPASLSFCVVEALSGDNTQRTQVATSSSSSRYAVTAKSSSSSYLSSNAATANNTTANATSAHTNMQPFITVNYIICTGRI